MIVNQCICNSIFDKQQAYCINNIYINANVIKERCLGEMDISTSESSVLISAPCMLALLSN